MPVFEIINPSDPPTSRAAGVIDRRSHRRTVLVCLVEHGPLSAPWIAARWLTWISPESIRESLIWLERCGLAVRTRQEERTPRGCWADDGRKRAGERVRG